MMDDLAHRGRVRPVNAPPARQGVEQRLGEHEGRRRVNVLAAQREDFGELRIGDRSGVHEKDLYQSSNPPISAIGWDGDGGSGGRG